jgi:hypothetical protein
MELGLSMTAIGVRTEHRIQVPIAYPKQAFKLALRSFIGRHIVPPKRHHTLIPLTAKPS